MALPGKLVRLMAVLLACAAVALAAAAGAPPRTDRYGDPLPAGAFLRLGTVRFRHDAHIFCLALSPDGRTAAAGSFDGTVRLWDVRTGKELRRVVGNLGAFMAIAFTPDGKRLATGGDDQSVYLWDAATGAAVSQFTGHADRVVGLAFASDGKLLAGASADHTVLLWDVGTGELVRRLRGHADAVHCVTFSPDGKLVAAGAFDLTVLVWDAATGRQVCCHCLGRPPPEFAGEVGTVSFSPDGKVLAAVGICADPGGKSSEGGLALWDTATGKQIRMIREPKSVIRCLAFWRNGTVLAAAVDGTLHLWDAASGKELARPRGLPPHADLLAYAADGRTVVGTRAQALHVADLAAGRELLPFAGSDGGIEALAFAPDGKTVAAAGSDGPVHLWDVASGTEAGRPLVSLLPAAALAFAPDGRTLAVRRSDTGDVLLLDLATRKPRNRFGVESGWPFFFAPGGRSLVAGRFVYDPATGKVLRQLAGDHRLCALSWDLRLAVRDRRPVRVSELESGKVVRTFAQGAEEVALSPDGRTLAAKEVADQEVVLWEVASGLERSRFKGTSPLDGRLAFAPDGRTLAFGGGDTTILLWDLTGRSGGGRLASALPDDLWAQLADHDAGRAYRAMWALALDPARAVPFLRGQHLRRRPADPARLDRLVTALNSDRFHTRKAAEDELERLGEAAEPRLRRALAETPPLETRKRIERLLDRLERSPERLRLVRAVEALEHIGTPDARALLEEVTRGPADLRLTREARQALHRLSLRPTMKP